MAEKISITVDLGALADFTPSEGLGGNSLMAKDGSYSGKILKILQKKSESGNPMWLVQQIVEDQDEKGASLLNNVLLGGKDRNGDSLARQLGQFLISCGYTTEQIRGFAKTGSVDGEALANKLCVGKTVYFTAEAESYEGKLTSKVKNYITEQAYKDAVAANAHRKPHNAAVSFAGPPAGVTAGPTNVGGAAATGAPAGANGAAKDPLAALAGLNIGL